ncbi:MAG: hypothetical protein R2865_14800 [Deinococcales bacterium]
MTYQAGQGLEGSHARTPVRKDCRCPRSSLLPRHDFVEPSHKRIMLALTFRVQWEWGQIGGVPNLSPRVAGSVPRPDDRCNRASASHHSPLCENWFFKYPALDSV